MKLEVTLTSDEYAALCKFPGASAQQRFRALIRFWQAVCDEYDKREAAEKRNEIGAKLNAVFKRASEDGILPKTVEDLTENTEHYQEKIGELSEYVQKHVEDAPG